MHNAIAVAQFAPTDDAVQNLATMRSLAAEARDRGASLVVFPEYAAWFRPDLGADWVEAARPLAAHAADLGAISADLGIHLVAGVLERVGERASNTIVAVDPSGAMVATYRKLHLYDAFGAKESEWIQPGDIASPETFAWDGFTVGMQTCYDIRFPEVTRWLVDAGADLVLVPAEWVRGPLKEHHWHTLVTARAIENTIYVAAADHTPPIGVGNSMIVDPMGVEIASLGDETGVAIAWPAPERIARVRETNPALTFRRFSVTPKTQPLP
jgi:deaminated glutathione amidase